MHQGALMDRSKTVAVACDSAAGLAGDISGHFGHTPFFVVAEIVDGRVTSSRSVASPGHGEGCNMPTFVHSLGATSVIVGGIGGGAVNGLARQGIEVVAGASGNAGDTLKSYAAGSLISGAPGCHGHGHGGGRSHSCSHHHE
jgi:predicted Fe-Mo cluster-binding NifX family protein